MAHLFWARFFLDPSSGESFFSLLLASECDGKNRKIIFLLKEGLFLSLSPSSTILGQEYDFNVKVFFDFLFKLKNERDVNTLLKSFAYDGFFQYKQEKFSLKDYSSFIKIFLRYFCAPALEAFSEKGFYRVLRTYVKLCSNFVPELFFSPFSEVGSLIYLNSPILEISLNLLKEARNEMSLALFKGKNERKTEKFLRRKFSLPRLFRKKNIALVKELSFSKRKKNKIKSFLVLGALKNYILEHLARTLRERIREGGHGFFLLNLCYYLESLEVRFGNLKHYSYQRSFLLIEELEPLLEVVFEKNQLLSLQRLSFLLEGKIFYLDPEDRSVFDYYRLFGKDPRLLLATFELLLKYEIVKEFILDFLTSSVAIEDLLTWRDYSRFREFFDPVLDKIYELYHIRSHDLFPLY